MKGAEIRNEGNLECRRCRVALVPGKVEITYLKSTFPAELLKCPQCGQVFVPEELALGKMSEVEHTLEDK